MTVYAEFSPGTYTAAQARAGIFGTPMLQGASGIDPRSGVLPGLSAPLAVQASAGMNLTVAAGRAMVSGWSVVVDIATTVAIPAASTTARTDLVILRVYDTEAGDGAPSRGVLEVVKGTSLAVPATPARSLVLAQVSVGANVSTITGAAITDRRVMTAAAGGVLLVPGAAVQTPGVLGLSDGQVVWDSVADRLLVVNGNAWFVYSPGVTQSGTFSATFASGVATGTVNFPTPFVSAPDVAITGAAITGNTPLIVAVTATTTTGFTYRVQPWNGGSYSGTLANNRYVAFAVA